LEPGEVGFHSDHDLITVYSRLIFSVLVVQEGVMLFLALGVLTITFTKDIAPILQDRCQECHHNGSIAPMSLVTYEETRPWAKSMRQRVLARQMPPWHIDKTIGVQKFKNDISLSDEQIDKIVGWVD